MEFPFPRPGDTQREYRAQLAREGWKPICTYMQVEYRIALERLRRQHELKTLHEALDLVQAACSLPLFDGITVKRRTYRASLPCRVRE
ncbi:MAG: hypothetical protein WAS21_14945 [Geminicoccaceae bacterium]